MPQTLVVRTHVCKRTGAFAFVPHLTSKRRQIGHPRCPYLPEQLCFVNALWRVRLVPNSVRAAEMPIRNASRAAAVSLAVAQLSGILRLELRIPPFRDWPMDVVSCRRDYYFRVLLGRGISFMVPKMDANARGSSSRVLVFLQETGHTMIAECCN